MSIENASRSDLLLYCNAGFVNGCPIDYWVKNEEEKQEDSEINAVLDVSDANKSGKAIGWYVAGMAHCLGAMIAKVANFFVMIGVNLVLAINYAILRNEGEKGQERSIRCKVALYILADTGMAIGIDFIGVFCPPVAYKLHTLVKEKFMAPVFEKYEIISSKEDYGFSSFKERLEIAK